MRALIVLVLMMASVPAYAEPAKQPLVVHMGMLVLDIHNVDLKLGTAEVTYYIWTRWRSDDPDIGTKYELVNGTVDSKEGEYKTKVDGEQYAYYRVRAKVKMDVDLREFPFDRHVLELELEHASEDSSVVKWAVDEAPMRELGSPQITGWDVRPPRYEVVETIYKTNFGLPGASANQAGKYSRFRLSIELHHGSSTTFAKSFLALFISMLIAWLAFFIHPDVVDGRVGVGVAGVFGVVTSYMVVSSSLPEISYLTLSDKIHLTGLAFVFLSILQSCLAAHFARTERLALARRLDRRVLSGIAATYTLLVVLFIVTR